MDIFDVLKAISKRKVELVRVGMNEKDALRNAASDISNEFHIRLQDIRKLYSIWQYKNDTRMLTTLLRIILTYHRMSY